jgi:anti-sigma factor RsiW
MKKSKNCRHLLALLSDYIDDDLGDELCEELERHLSGCPDCQVVVDTLRKTISLVHADSAPPPVPTEVRERLYKCLDLDDYLTQSVPEK